MNIYELGNELQELQKKMEDFANEHEGDITSFPLMEELESVQGDFEAKALNIACWIINLRAGATAIKDQAKALADRSGAVSRKADRLEEYLTKNIQPGQKFEDARCKIGWRKSKQVKIECLTLDLPEEFIRFPEPEPKKTELKKAVEGGAKIEGVDVVENWNIQIK
jgi:hypothetical protein